MKKQPVLFLIFLTLFGRLSLAQTVTDYYQYAPKPFFKYFLEKFIEDNEFKALSSRIKTDPEAAYIWKKWLEQVDYWTFQKDSIHYPYLQIVYEVKNFERKLLFYRFIFKDGLPADIKGKLTVKTVSQSPEALFVSNKNEVKYENAESLKKSFNQNIIELPQKIGKTFHVKYFEDFPFYFYNPSNNSVSFYFKKWRIPVNYVLIDGTQPMGFIVQI